ncbi:MAG: AMP-binding protein [Bacteroidales bacterium]|nr:AMP-binding protein [Bacteroidales bacterium]
MAEHQSYDELTRDFSWSIAEKELDYTPGDIINIGWHCSDRICLKGDAGKVALYYEGFGGTEKSYTFNDIRLAGNTIGAFLRKQGITEGDRVCLFMDRIPELYLSFLGNP